MAFTDSSESDCGNIDIKEPRNFNSQPDPSHGQVSKLNTPGDYHDGLPPVDRGTHAWLFLLASAMLEALVWGMFSLGADRE